MTALPKPVRRRAFERAARVAARQPGRCVVGLGYKRTRSRKTSTGTPAICFFVDRKKPLKSLPPSLRIPRYFVIMWRGEAWRVPTDVQRLQQGRQHSLMCRSTRGGLEFARGTVGFCCRALDQVLTVTAGHVAGAAFPKFPPASPRNDGAGVRLQANGVDVGAVRRDLTSVVVEENGDRWLYDFGCARSDRRAVTNGHEPWNDPWLFATNDWLEGAISREELREVEVHTRNGPVTATITDIIGEAYPFDFATHGPWLLKYKSARPVFVGGMSGSPIFHVSDRRRLLGLHIVGADAVGNAPTSRGFAITAQTILDWLEERLDADVSPVWG